jgi:hypothetical protein
MEGRGFFTAVNRAARCSDTVLHPFRVHKDRPTTSVFATPAPSHSQSQAHISLPSRQGRDPRGSNPESTLCYRADTVRARARDRNPSGASCTRLHTHPASGKTIGYIRTDMGGDAIRYGA